MNRSFAQSGSAPRRVRPDDRHREQPRPGHALAAGEQTGRIRGVVTDDTGQALAGVTIIATSPALIGEPRVVMGDERGRYEIDNLPPGIYNLEYSYTGLRPMKLQAEVRQGEAQTPERQLHPGADRAWRRSASPRSAA